MAAFFPVGFDLETSVHRSSSSSDSRGCTPLRRWPTATGCPVEEREWGRSTPTGACARADWGIGPCDACAAAASAVDDTFPGCGAESGHEARSAYVGCGPTRLGLHTLAVSYGLSKSKNRGKIITLKDHPLKDHNLVPRQKLNFLRQLLCRSALLLSFCENLFRLLRFVKS